ncbi:MAG: DUF169 domain-containing protein [Deltaproteobacteria bacterium]|nr:DUF169 domain-containing protein [Deltaproteobacteria bacterium]
MKEMIKIEQVAPFLEAVGLDEEPMGMCYTDEEPKVGISPKPQLLPTIEMESRGEVDWSAVFDNFSCVVGNIWRARRKKIAAYFDQERFGCLGGAFYLGFLKPQLDFITYYVSTGIPGQLEGERYLESPEVTRKFFDSIDPPAAPARFCVFKPISQFEAESPPELVIFFVRAEVVSGLHQLATFVTNDFETVLSPFGAGCANIVTWPLRYLASGKLKAVLGGWDPSERKYLKTDEITFTVPFEMFERMVKRWPESFLTTKTWATIRKKIDRSKRAWGEVA